MCEIWTMGEMIVEIMRDRPDVSFQTPGVLLGPYPSGAPAIFIDTVARLGHSAGIIGGVGDDGFGKMLLSRLAKDGVNTDYVRVDEQTATGAAFVTYSSDGSREFIFHLANTPAVHPKEFDVASITGTKYFHIMGCSLMAQDAFREKILDAAKKFMQAGAKISFDPNIRPELLHRRKIEEILDGLLENCSVIMPGAEELKMLTGESDIQAGIHKLFQYETMELIALKAGSKCSILYTREEQVRCPSYHVEQVDPTGAGDCFDAALLCGLMEGKPLAHVGKMAAAAGALNVMKQGPMEGEISVENINKLILSQEG